jgi:SAM-dependent methyltransferase/tetratricopeptide (TPR) repeat protein
MFGELPSMLPQDPDTLHAAGVLGLRVGQAQRAETFLVRAIELRSDRPAYHCNLAIAYRRLGKFAPAIEQLRVALELDPEYAEAHVNLGNLLLDSGDTEAARLSFKRGLEIRRDYADALSGLGQIELAAEDHLEACVKFESALAIDPQYHEAYFNLAIARLRWAGSLSSTAEPAAAAAAANNAGLAIEAISNALRLSPENPAYWAHFASCLRHFGLRYPLNDSARALLSRALDHPAVNPGNLVRPIVSLANSHPNAVEISRRSKDFDDFTWPIVKDLVRDLLAETLLLRVMQDSVIPNAFLERVFTHARRAVLHDASSRAEDPALPLEVIAAIAHQSFNTEYVYEESVEERAVLLALREAIVSARAGERRVPLHWYGAYAAYRPLNSLDDADQIAIDLAQTPLSLLATRQILEPREEQRLRATIPILTATAGEVSSMVQAQYESNPYPRWLRVDQNFAPASVGRVLRKLFPLADLKGVIEGPARILIAGCGTGRHSIDTAQRFSDSTILALDLSLTSLAYAKRKTRELGITNIDYAQGDILGLESIADRFDVIECSGVLHHLENPLAGWRTLCSLLKPHGVMRIGLYSEIARQYIVHGRDSITKEGFESTADGLRRCRTAIFARTEDELLARITSDEDFYTLSGCRDLLFHVQEHRLTLTAIADMLESLNLTFIGFELADPAIGPRYRTRFPDDPGLSSLANWNRFEQDNPDTFRRMYQFWVQRKT